MILFHKHYRCRTCSEIAERVQSSWPRLELRPTTLFPFTKKQQSLQHLQTSQTKQDAVGDGILRPRCRHLANSTKHTRCVWFGPFAPLTRRHPQNRKYIKYCTAVREGPSHGRWEMDDGDGISLDSTLLLITDLKHD